MRSVSIPGTDLRPSRIAYGCMKLGGGWDDAPITTDQRRTAFAAIEAALDAGYTCFDHADIYCRGKSESVFGEFLCAHPGLRDRLVIQSKCGIRPELKLYDLSYRHIIHSVDGILDRLGIEFIDLLLLHRPDPLTEPNEVARAFDELTRLGKVRHFGVSNHNSGQMALLQRAIRQPLVVNQLELNLSQSALIAEGVQVNQSRTMPSALSSGILDHCRLNNSLVQSWAPTAGGRLLSQPPDASVPAVTRLINDLAAARQVSGEAILLAWLLRHPAGIQPVFGSLRPDRIRAAAAAMQIALTPEEWYALFTTALGRPLA